ncbi:MAG: metal ABC transporter permease [Planctomycetota bacterium]|nr:metal ABC transporter permease [Planctomycetota bacterium]
MLELLGDHTFRTVCLGTGLIGATSGALGCFSYLRRQALIGDVVSHASLLGIVGAFAISALIAGTGTKAIVVLIPGALVAGVLALLLTRAITSRTRVKEDAALGVMLAVFFGTGILLLRVVQRSPRISGHAGLEDYVFGLAAALTQGDLLLIAVLGALAIATMILLWGALKLHTFDSAFAHSMGFDATRVDTILAVLQVTSIVIGIHAVGVVLMIALLVTPASAARQWTRSLRGMVILSAIFGAVSGAGGSLLSALYARAPTGPMIVLVATAIFIVSILFAPDRGILARYRSRKRRRRAVLGAGGA